MCPWECWRVVVHDVSVEVDDEHGGIQRVQTIRDCWCASSACNDSAYVNAAILAVSCPPERSRARTRAMPSPRRARLINAKREEPGPGPY